MPVKVWMDADACPRVIKTIIYRAADRLEIPLFVVANTPIPIPESDFVNMVLVPKGFDGADKYIIQEVTAADVVVTADIPLAAKIVAKGAVGIDPRGKVYTENNIGEILSVRNFMQELRSGGLVQGGPPEFSSTDSNRFAAAFDRELTKKLKTN